MVNPSNESEDFTFELTRKRRKGFPSETHVRRPMNQSRCRELAAATSRGSRRKEALT